jgi:hypothetical protein
VNSSPLAPNSPKELDEQSAPPSVRWLPDTYACPDCLSDNSVPVRDDHGIWHLNVMHEGTCPTYTRLLAEGRAS